MDFTETKIDETYYFKGKIMQVRVDHVRLPNGNTATREVCEHVGGVGVLPITKTGEIVLVRQFRYPYGRVLLEIPAGKMDHGPEDAAACGARELREETGFSAARLVPLGEIYPSPGFMTESVYLFAALELTGGACAPDEDEFVETLTMPIAALEEKIAAGEVRDAKTIVAMYRARLLGLL